jgi:hypothetical protein
MTRLSTALPHFCTGVQHSSQPWLAENIRLPAAADPPVLKQRLRPLIYIYDLPSDYNTRMLQVEGPA